jgi:hypothetical protein
MNDAIHVHGCMSPCASMCMCPTMCLISRKWRWPVAMLGDQTTPHNSSSVTYLVRWRPSCADCRIYTWRRAQSQCRPHRSCQHERVLVLHRHRSPDKYSREAYPLHTSMKPPSRRKVLAERTASCYFKETTTFDLP